MDHDNYAHSNGYPDGPNSAVWSNVSSGKAANFTFWMKYVYSMQNMTFGVGGGLKPVCETHFPDEPHLCFMSPHMVQLIRTPFFMINSKYDKWQLQNILQTQWSDADQMKAILQYGKDFLQALQPVMASDFNRGGG